MNYLSISPYTVIPRYGIKKTHKTNPQISFEGNSAMRILDKFSEFSLNEYSKLTPREISLLRAEYQKLIRNGSHLFYEKLEKVHEFVSDLMKEYFDLRFGKGNYVVVPLGSSLSSFSKVLGYKIGEHNVVNIPLSGGSRFYSSSISSMAYERFLNQVVKEEDIKSFLNFLKSKNLSRSDVEKSGKNYILLDYCYTGQSLTGINQLFKSDLVWSNRKQNIFTVDLEEIIPKDNPNPVLSSLYDDLYLNLYKEYSFVDKSLNFKSTVDSQGKKVISNKEQSVKLLWFKLLDNFVNRKTTSQINLSQLYPLGWKNLFYNVNSKFENDIRDIMGEINKFIIKADNLDLGKVRNNKRVSEWKKELNNLYTFVLDCFNLRNKSKTRVDFYKRQTEICEFLKSSYNIFE